MVDKFWPQLEQDFALVYRMRAMDWFDTDRDWREFYRLKQKFGRGTESHTAMMNDDEVAQEIAEWQRNSKQRGPANPPANGFTDLMHKLADIEDKLLVVAHSMGGDGNIQWTPRPKYKSDEIADYLSKKNSRRIQAMLVPHDNIQQLE